MITCDIYTHTMLPHKMGFLFSLIVSQSPKVFSKHVNALMTGCVFVFFANQVFQRVWPIRSALEKYVQLIHCYYC